VYVSELRAAITGIHQRWEHGHDGLTPGCTLCAGERAEVAALTAVSAALRPQHQAAPLPAHTERSN
jgi:hypothetical protein